MQKIVYPALAEKRNLEKEKQKKKTDEKNLIVQKKKFKVGTLVFLKRVGLQSKWKVPTLRPYKVNSQNKFGKDSTRQEEVVPNVEKEINDTN